MSVVEEAEPSVGVVMGLRNFQLYLLARAVSDVGDGIIAVTLAFAALHFGATPAQVGIVLLAGRLPITVVMLTGPVLSARLPRTSVLVGANVFRFGSQGLTAGLLLAGRGNVWALASLQALTASATAIYLPVSEAVVADVVDQGARQQANAILGLERSVTMVAAPALAGVIVAVAGVAFTFAFDAATFGASALLLMGLHVGVAPVRREGLLEAVLTSVRALRGKRWLWITSAEAGLVNALCVAPILVLGPVVAERHLSGAPSWALISTSLAVGAAAGGLVMLAWRPRYPIRAAMWLALLIAPFPAALAYAAPLPVITAAAFLTGLQSTVFNTVTQTARQNHFSSELRVPAAAVSNMVALSSIPLGMALAGWWAGLSGLAAVLWIAAIVAVAAPLGSLTARSVRLLPATHQPVVTS